MAFVIKYYNTDEKLKHRIWNIQTNTNLQNLTERKTNLISLATAIFVMVSIRNFFQLVTFVNCDVYHL